MTSVTPAQAARAAGIILALADWKTAEWHLGPAVTAEINALAKEIREHQEKRL